MNKHERKFSEYIKVLEIIEFTNGDKKQTAYKTEIAEVFERYGGSFVHSLGVALRHADWNNSAKIIKTWSNYVEQYFNEYILPLRGEKE